MDIWIVNHYAIPPSMGGLVRHFYFSKYLQQKGHKVKIFTSSKIHNTDINLIRDKSLYKEEMEDGVEYTFVRSKDYKGNGLDRIWNIVDFPFKIWKTMKIFYKKKKPDVLYTSSPDLFVAFFVILFGKKNRIPVVVEIRDLWPESIVVYNNISRKNIVIQILYQLEKKIYMEADEIIFTMRGGLDYIKSKKWERYIDLSKIHHINNGVDIDEYMYNREHFCLKDEVLEDKNFFNIIYAGSIRKVNGIDKLVEIAKYLEDNGYECIRFLVYGDGNDRERLERYCSQNNINNVCFMGKIDKKYIPYVLSKGKVNFVHGVTTSILKYGCSLNKLFDYIASGKPIVSDLGTRYDLVEHYKLGKTVKIPTVENIANAFIEVFTNYSVFSKEIYDRCKEVAEYYDYQQLTEELEKILIDSLEK